MRRALVVEDDVTIRRLIDWCLRIDGWKTEVASDGIEGAQKAEMQNPHLIVLDLILPRLQGSELLSRIREWSKAWVIVVSQMIETENKIKLLRLGADDYVTKPFDCDELRAHFGIASRRIGFEFPTAPGILECNDLVMDLRAASVIVSGKEVKLTPHEFLILKSFMTRIGEMVTVNTLLQEGWADAFAKPSHLHVVISNLRCKLGLFGERIVNIHGMGYKLTDKPDQTADRIIS